MSIFITAKAKCFNCGTEAEVQLAASLNADRRPDLRTQVMDGTFQATDCPNCGTRMRLPAHLTYIHQRRGQWILVESPDELANAEAVEEEARNVFAGLYGADAPEAAQEIGRELKPRLVFGWPALREKLLADEYGLDDVTLELLKIAVIRNVSGSPLSDSTELRLTGQDAGQDTGQDGGVLHFAWLESESEKHIATLDVPRESYDDLVGDAAWEPLRAQLEGKFLVDFKRLLVT